MRRVLFCIACVVMLTAGIEARTPQIYFGAALQYAGIGETNRRYFADDDYHTKGQHSETSWNPGWGGQLETGLIADYWSVYCGFRESTACEKDYRSREAWYHQYHSAATIQWYNSRLLLGARLRESDRLPGSIKPMAGAGISYGWLKRTYREIVEPHYPAEWAVNITQTRNGCLGAFAEAGVLVKIRGPLMLTILLNYEELWTSLPAGAYGTLFETSAFHEFGGRIGVHYVLKAAY